MVCVSITGSKTNKGKIPESIAHKGKARTVIIIPELQDLIEQYIRLLKSMGLTRTQARHFKCLAPDNVFLSTSRTERIVSQELNSRMDSLIDKSGLKSVGITRKSLLRRFVIEMYLREISPKDIAYISGLGESSVAQTLMMNMGQYDSLLNYFAN